VPVRTRTLAGDVRMPTLALTVHAPTVSRTR
jgi:hypothetical protein